MKFQTFKTAVQKQFKRMTKDGNPVFVANTDKDTLINTYLDSFPEGTNEIYRERREYDCNCCRQFIRDVGNTVAYVKGSWVTIWDIYMVSEPEFQQVAEAMASYVKSCGIRDVFLHTEAHAGTDKSREMLDNGSVHTWDHFYVDVPVEYHVGRYTKASKLSELRSNAQVLERSLEELTSESAEVVLELIEQNSIYRGEEHKSIVQLFLQLKRKYDQAQDKKAFAWMKSSMLEGASKIRNTVIGSLLVDLSDGRDLEQAVKSFESKVAPQNYKRPTALITKGMIDKAQKKIKELNMMDSLPRRHAVTDDITINNVLYADQSVKEELNVFDELARKASAKSPRSFDKVEEMSVSKFLKDVLPKASSVELMLDNQLKVNLMTLVAPVNPAAPNMLKWSNNFSFSYNGDVADAMKEQVKEMGGDVEGDFRFSIKWNGEGETNLSDLDAHCKGPQGIHLYFSDKKDRYSTGKLDVDITNPRGVAVENITFSDRSKMPNGKYDLEVHQYTKRSGSDGFQAQIEFDGTIYDYSFPTNPNNESYTKVATVTAKNGQFSIVHHLPVSSQSVNIWGLDTQVFHKVDMIMNSPNHWDGECVGNNHLFFILDGCKNPDSVRGFYNEYLKPELNEHRKVFEVLASKMKADYNEDQLSGVGFSSTQKNEVVLKVTGATSRIVKVKFG